VERLSSGLGAWAVADARLEARLGERRAALADRLHAVVPMVDTPLRRFVLAVRRDCHNGRPLARHLAAPQWPALRDAAGPVAAEVAGLEARAARRAEAFRAEVEAERKRGRRVLAGVARDPTFVRALALASDDLPRAARALAEGRADAGAEAALLRYLCRAAVKVSPFSTFTSVALGVAAPGAGRSGLRLRGERRTERSLVRLRRFRLQQCLDALARVPAFRDGLPVVFNDSAVETGPGRLLMLRPGRWEGDAERATLRFRPDDLVRTGAGTPLAARAAHVLARGEATYASLAATLVREGAARGEAVSPAEVERLLELGVVRLAFPWPVHEPHLEEALAVHLRTLPDDPALAPFAERLERLVALEHGYARAADPAASLREMRRLSAELWRAAASASGVDAAPAAPGESGAYDLYEDVLVRRADRPALPVVHLCSRAARRALRSAAPLVRLATLFDRRHELRLALADFAAERWPGEGEVPALELFSAAQPLWRDYLAFRAREWKDHDRVRGWNPRGLAEVDALKGWRERVMGAVGGCAVPDGDVRRVDERALEALLAGVPAEYTDPAGSGACLFLQPASTDGSLWRLNAVREGTGRFGSRYTPLLDDAVRGRYAAHLAARGTAVVGGERAFLLDVQCVAGDTLNVHDPLCPAVLAFPGDRAGVAPHRRVRLGELRVCFGPGAGAVLRDGSGRRLLPVHLGLAFEAYIPSIARFLCAFGPGEMGALLPARGWRTEGEVRVADRTLLGNLVVHRRGWSVPAAPLAAALAQAGPAAAFAAANRLRAEWGIPERVFVSRPARHGALGTVHKPQYVDFSCPLFIPLLRAAVDGAERVAFEEMLPTPEMCPRDGAGERRAVEVLVDSISFRRPAARLRARAATADAHSGRTPAASAAG
jgi:hypothetical protein